jgi:hypothetical protein
LRQLFLGELLDRGLQDVHAMDKLAIVPGQCLAIQHLPEFVHPLLKAGLLLFGVPPLLVVRGGVLIKLDKTMLFLPEIAEGGGLSAAPYVGIFFPEPRAACKQNFDDLWRLLLAQILRILRWYAVTEEGPFEEFQDREGEGITDPLSTLGKQMGCDEREMHGVWAKP